MQEPCPIPAPWSYHSSHAPSNPESAFSTENRTTAVVAEADENLARIHDIESLTDYSATAGPHHGTEHIPDLLCETQAKMEAQAPAQHAKGPEPGPQSLSQASLGGKLVWLMHFRIQYPRHPLWRFSVNLSYRKNSEAAGSGCWPFYRS